MKLLKIKVGEVFIDKTTHPVFTTAWERKSKEGVTYYEIRTPVFVAEVEDKKKEEKKPQKGLEA